MPIVVPVGSCLVQARFTNSSGHNCQNSCSYDLTSVFTQVTADAASDQLAAVYKSQLSTASRFNGVHVIVGNDGPPIEFDSNSSAGAGLVSASLMTPQVQGLIRKSTAFGGRKNRGRMFIPDMVETQVDDTGNIDSTGRGKLTAIANAWFDMTSADAVYGDPQILHTDGVTAPTVITAIVTETRVATLRRRYTR